MIVSLLWFALGLAALVRGGDWFVDGAVAMATRFRLPETLIGATVVSIGTTLPEVMVSVTSAASGHGELAYGNAVGSVLCDAALIAGLSIAVRGRASAGRRRCRRPFSSWRRGSTALRRMGWAALAGGRDSPCWRSLPFTWL